MQQTADPTWASPLLFALFFVVLWLAVAFVISRFGWHGYATRHPAAGRPATRRYLASSAAFGSVLGSYRNVVLVAFSPPGLHFSTLLPFRAFHRPFLLPWSSVTSAALRAGLFGVHCHLDIDDGAGRLRVRLPGAVEGELRAYWPGMARPVDDPPTREDA